MSTNANTQQQPQTQQQQPQQQTEQQQQQHNKSREWSPLEEKASMDLLNTSRVAAMDCMELEQELRTNVETGLRIGDALQRQVDDW